MHSAFKQTLLSMVAEGDRERVYVLTPEEVPACIAALAPKYGAIGGNELSK